MRLTMTENINKKDKEVLLEQELTQLRKEFCILDRDVHYDHLRNSDYYEGFKSGCRCEWLRNRIKSIEKEFIDLSTKRKSATTFKNAAIGLTVFCSLVTVTLFSLKY
jgi:hypothetical protein